MNNKKRKLQLDFSKTDTFMEKLNSYVWFEEPADGEWWTGDDELGCDPIPFGTKKNSTYHFLESITLIELDDGSVFCTTDLRKKK